MGNSWLLLAIFSFLPVYSAASNLAYTQWNGNTFSFFVKHFMHLFLGFAIMYGVHKIPYRYFKGLSLVMIPIVLILLINNDVSGNDYRRSKCKSMDSNSYCSACHFRLQH
jgi:cell division protein FtsW